DRDRRSRRRYTGKRTAVDHQALRARPLDRRARQRPRPGDRDPGDERSWWTDAHRQRTRARHHRDAAVSDRGRVSMRRRILIVEDDPALAGVVRNTFVVDGFDVTLARNGDEAISISRANPPDLILLDLMLPGPNGL